MGVVAVIAGALIGVFQLVGRTDLMQLVGGGEPLWFFELRIWFLAILSLWVCATIAVRGPRTRLYFPGFRAIGGMFIVFVIFMIISSLWAPDEMLARRKAYDLFFVAWSIVLTVTALGLYGPHGIIEGFWGALFGLGLVLAVFGVEAVLSGTQGGRLRVLGGGPNVYGRNMSLLTVAALRYVFDDRRWMRVPSIVAAPLGVLLVFLSGSRGAILSLLVGVIVYAAMCRSEPRVVRSLFVIVIVGLVAIATQFGQFAVRMFQDRFIVLLLVENYFTHRDILLMEGLRSGIQNPLGGLGLAGFAQVGSRGSHPHNIFVEAFAEGGLLGLSLLSIPFVKYVRRWRKGMGLGDPAIAAGLALLVVSSSISGDLFDARGVFILVLIAMATQLQFDLGRKL